MKINNKLLFFLACFGFVLACKNEDEIRFPDLLEGANVRIQFLDAADQNLNFQDIANAQIKYNIFSQNKNIDHIDISALYTNAVTGDTVGPRLFKRYIQSDFDAANGAIREETFSADELATFFGLTGSAEFNGADNIQFFNTTSLTDGRVYPSPTPGGNINIEPGITQSPATESFSVGWTTYVACPINATFDGDYDTSEDLCYDGAFTGPVTLTNLGGPIYDMSGFTIYGFEDRSINILLVCGQVLIPPQSPGLSCGGDALLMQTAAVAGTYDADDSGTLTLRIDYPSDCGGAFSNCEIVLTRQED
jgi:hypothetical protein